MKKGKSSKKIATEEEIVDETVTMHLTNPRTKKFWVEFEKSFRKARKRLDRGRAAAAAYLDPKRLFKGKPRGDFNEPH